MINSDGVYNALKLMKKSYDYYKDNQLFFPEYIQLYNHSLVFTDDYIDIPEIDLKTNTNYVLKELEWYLSQSLSVKTMKDAPTIWVQVSDSNSQIHSNYGYLIFNSFNGNQYANVAKELSNNPNSRRAVMYYTNPFMHYIGDKDHICTLAVSYYIKDNKVHASVMMRSQDIIFGLLNDLPWQMFVLRKLGKDLYKQIGEIHWFCVNLHIYERHYKYLERIKDGNN